MLYLVVIPIIVAVIVQLIKLATDNIPNNLDFAHMIRDYGGMPSSHSAFVAALATVVGLAEGFNSAAFAIAFVLMAVVIRDAVGFRREIGRNAVFTNIVARAALKKKNAEQLNERMGHTPKEALVGLVLGICLAGMFYFLLTGF